MHTTMHYEHIDCIYISLHFQPNGDRFQRVRVPSSLKLLSLDCDAIAHDGTEVYTRGSIQCTAMQGTGRHEHGFLRTTDCIWSFATFV
jgi:hypothetical protein